MSALIIGFLPVVNQAVTGNWRLLPWNLYAIQYAPFDRLGFGLPQAPAERALTPEMAAFNEIFTRIHRDHVPSAIPRIAGQRVALVYSDMFSTWRFLLVPLSVLGLVCVWRELLVGFASAVVLVTLYLGYAHAPTNYYYLETVPIFAAAAAVGWWRLATWVWTGSLAGPLDTLRSRGVLMATGVLIGVLSMVVVALVQTCRTAKQEAMMSQRNFKRAVAALPEERVMVFVRQAPWYRSRLHQPLVTNNADLELTRAWIVHDSGADNVKLIAVAPERAAYVYDEATGALFQYSPRSIDELRR